MKQRILTLILMVSIVISMATIPISVSAATNGGCGESLKWSLDDNGTLTISGEGEMYDYNYDVRDGKGYTNTPWCDKISLIKRVIIGEGVTKIGNYAFRDSKNLTDVTFPNSLIELGKGAFFFTNLSKVVIPDSVTIIGPFCFSGCFELNEVQMGKNIEYIGKESFRSTKLTTITLPQSLNYIGEAAFNMSNLNTIYYEGSIKQWNNINKANAWDYNYLGIEYVIKYKESENNTDYATPDFNVSAQSNVRVYLNGEKIAFDVQPQIINGRTMVPMRKIFEELGAIVGWFEDNQEIWANRGDTTIRMNIGYPVMYRNIKDIYLDVVPQLVNGRTLVPVRAIAESFDADVQWDGNTNSVLITVDDLAIKCTNCIDGCIGCHLCTEYEKDINTKYQILRWEIENGTSSSKVSTAFDAWRTSKVSQLDHILDCSTWGRKECTTCNGTGLITK